MAVLRRNGKLGAASNLWQGRNVSVCDRSQWPAPDVWARHGPLLRENCQRAHSSRNRLHHGRIHGKKAGPPRYDRRYGGSAEIVVFARGRWVNPNIAAVIRFERHENHSPSPLLEYLHDNRLVRPPEIPQGSAFRRHRRELADRVRGVLLSSSGEPHRLRRIHSVSIENHPGSDHAMRVRRVRLVVSGRRNQMEPRGLVPVSGGCSNIRLLGEIVAVRRAGWMRRAVMLTSFAYVTSHWGVAVGARIEFRRAGR